MYRNIKLAPKSSKAAPEALAVFLFDKPREVPAELRRRDKALDGVMADALKRSEFSAGRGSITPLYRNGRPGRIYLCGLGDPDKFDANALRQTAARLVRTAFGAQVKRLELVITPTLGDRLDADRAGSAVGDGIAIAGFEFNQFKGAASGDADGKKPIDLQLVVENGLRDAFERSLTVGQGQQTARTLAATPPNVARPSYIVRECRKLARRAGLKCTVIDEDKAKDLGMGGLLAVGGGGSEDPALVCLEWQPKATRGRGKKKSKTRTGKTDDAPIMLVGKAVTFDTGGYSLKPSTGMTGMKYDKCGGMTVIGIMEAVAALKLPIPIVALIPVAENMIDDDAYRVDDILTFANGVTAEVTNTDAEGRLILADALAYGTKQYRPRAVIDLATLTGGVVVALGTGAAGYFCNDEDLAKRLEDAADVTGEKVWRLPLWDEHRDLMKGTHADLVNSGEREAHPIQGAAFLSFFVGDDAPKQMPTTPWIHLDIAGTATTKRDTDLYPKGPTGYGVRLVTQLLQAWAG